MVSWTWIITGLSIAGVVLNIKKKRACFILWAVTNFVWMVVDYHAGIYSQAALFCVYFALALWGIYEWRK